MVRPILLQRFAFILGLLASITLLPVAGHAQWLPEVTIVAEPESITEAQLALAKIAEPDRVDWLRKYAAEYNWKLKINDCEPQSFYPLNDNAVKTIADELAGEGQEALRPKPKRRRRH